MANPGVTPAIVALVKQFEGWSETPYLDSVGIPTIGYGTTVYPNGTKVTMKDVSITRDRGEELLANDLSGTASGLWPYLKRQPSYNQWTALVSIAYNCGVTAIGESTLVRLFNQGDDTGAAGQFQRWDKGTVNGETVVIPGLHNRRLVEAKVFQS